MNFTRTPFHLFFSLSPTSSGSRTVYVFPSYNHVFYIHNKSTPVYNERPCRHFHPLLRGWYKPVIKNELLVCILLCLSENYSSWIKWHSKWSTFWISHMNNIETFHYFVVQSFNINAIMASDKFRFRKICSFWCNDADWYLVRIVHIPGIQMFTRNIFQNEKKNVCNRVSTHSRWMKPTFHFVITFDYMRFLFIDLATRSYNFTFEMTHHFIHKKNKKSFLKKENLKFIVTDSIEPRHFTKFIVNLNVECYRGCC